jgi:hypothetical protein
MFVELLALALSFGQLIGLTSYEPDHRVSRQEVACFVECFDLCLVPAPPDPAVQ